MTTPAVAIVPDYVQACIVISELLRVFAGWGRGQTVVSLTAEQGKAVEAASAWMEGHSADFAYTLTNCILRPLDEMPYCEDIECMANHFDCHVHKPAVAAALIHRWVETSTPMAQALAGKEALAAAWRALSDLAQTVDHPVTKKALDELGRQAFDTAHRLEVSASEEAEKRLAEIIHETANRAQKKHDPSGKAWSFEVARAVLKEVRGGSYGYPI